MSSHDRRYDTRTRPYAPPPPPRPPAGGGGVDLPTLIIAAVASVISALVVSHFWGAGTIAATAATPVIIALVKEALSRPAQRITEVSARAPSAAARVIGARHGAEGPTVVAEEIGPGGEEPSEYRVYGQRRRHWRLALLTGAVAFALAAAVITVPEVIAGHSIIRSSRGTTLLGGSSGSSSTHKSTSTATQTVTTVTRTTTTTAPTASTTTPAPTTTTVPAQTAPTTSTTTPAAPGPSATTTTP